MLDNYRIMQESSGLVIYLNDTLSNVSISPFMIDAAGIMQMHYWTIVSCVVTAKMDAFEFHFTQLFPTCYFIYVIFF